MTTTMTTPGAAGWIQYSGPNSADAKKFYATVLDWTIADMPMQDGSSFSGIMVDDAPIGGFSQVPAETGAWTIFVTVKDVDAATQKAKEAGATILSGPLDAPGVGSTP